MIFSNNKLIKNAKIDLFIDNNNHGNNDPLHLLPLQQIHPDSDTPYVKFLGVLIDHDLTFKYHISFVNSQLSKGLFFIRNAKNLFSEFCLHSLYYTLIHSNLTYAIQIWSCTSDNLLKPLLSKQKMAIRLINSAKYNSHTEPLFKKSNILPLPKLIQYFNIKFMQEYKNNFLPAAFNNYWPLNSDLRAHNPDRRELRDDSDLHVPFCRLMGTSKFPYFKLSRLWNEFELPNLTIIRDRSKFKINLKFHLLAELNPNPVCGRLFCHSCSNIV